MVKPLEFDDSVGKMIFMPQRDITAMEAVLLAQLFTRMTFYPSPGPLAWRAYASQYGLLRHFEPAMRSIS